MTQRTTESGFQLTAGVVKRSVQVAALLVVQAVLLFASAGRVAWPAAWAYLVIYLCNIGLNLLLLIPKGAAATELIEERARIVPEKKWDQSVGALLAVGHLAMLGVAGLDYRFKWSPVLRWPLQAIGLVVVAIGLAVASWAMLTNAYFSSTVRIQRERGHHVITDGPYQFVRHPGYGGFVIFTGATPLLLGSLWAFVPAAIVMGAIVARTWLEDRTLRIELEGYEAYSRRVQYRLIPGLW
ncbi:MAG TPA: isoprenylcysteine carboxylmethyltransferase family protein [bacterium]|nr:isoprenylcysteine carboxylmethyltransferase family protein [bacterium]